MSLARIPFSELDHVVIRKLNGWMLFLAVVHFIAALFALCCGFVATTGAVAAIARSPLGGVIYTGQMMSVPVLGAVMAVEGVFVLQARSALERVWSTDEDDLRHLSTAFRKLKLFFMLELVWFAVSLFTSFAGLLVQVIAPELVPTRPGAPGVSW